MTVAAAYLRVSRADDGDDESLTLETQRRRIKALCEARGWVYGPEYIDEGVSATKGRGEKTDWARLLSHVGTGRFDVIVARDLDRLLRTLQDLVKLIDLGAKVATVDGEIDLTTADGEFRATMLAAVARFEIRRKSERAIGANETRRRRGQPVTRVKILGYAEDGVTQVPNEAKAVKKAFEDYLAGVRITHIARELADEGFTSSKGRPWNNANIRSLLGNARYKGVITKWEADPNRRKVSGALTSEEYPGDWQAIVTSDVFDAVQQKLRDPSRKRHWGTEPRYLMSGLLVCSKCGDGTRMFTSWFYPPKRVRKSGEVVEKERVRIYRCLKANHLSRNAEPIEEAVRALVIARLRRDDAKALFADDEVAGLDREALRVERVALVERFEGLAALAAEGVLPLDKVREQSARLTGRINEIDGRLAPAPESIGRQIAESLDVAEAWDALDIARQRIVVEQLFEVTVLPAIRRKNVPRGQDLAVVWRT